MAANNALQGANPAQTLNQQAPLDIAVLLPCYNEAAAIADVVRDFSAALPAATIYVYDNNSVDGTAAIAAEAGAVVRTEHRQGKGNVVRRMFADVEADVYVLADGDGTYDAGSASETIRLLVERDLDFVNIARLALVEDAYRPGHRLGNYVLSRLVRVVFGRQLTDMLSGYKILSRRYVKSFPAMSRGFETETELAVHALELRLPMAEVMSPYRERRSGSISKLRTYRDGAKILLLIARLIKDERPFQFFGLTGLALIFLGLLLGAPVVVDYVETGLVPRLPSAVLSLGLVIVGVNAIFSGMVLEMVTHSRREMKRLFYIAADRRGR